MALEEYVGSIVLYVDGQEIEVTDIRPQTNTGRKLVKTMNRTKPRQRLFERYRRAFIADHRRHPEKRCSAGLG